MNGPGTARRGPLGRGPATQRADIVRAGRQDRILDRGEHVRELIAGFEDRLWSGQAARDRGLDGRVQGRVGGHQRTGLDDVGLFCGPVRAQAGGERGDLVARSLERRAGARQLGRGIARVRLDRRRTDAPDGAAARRRRGESVQPPLAHHASSVVSDAVATGDRRRPRAGGRHHRGRSGAAHQSSSARPSAEMISTVDAAPGSSWPIDRSPR